MKPLKFKKGVAHRAKNNARVKLNSLKEKMDQHGNTCMFPVDAEGTPCGKPAVRCHCIPEAEILKDQLRDPDTKKVGEFRVGMNPWPTAVVKDGMNNPDLFGPVDLPVGAAAMGHFACKTHDPEFNDSDVARPDYKDSRVSFQIAHRTLLYVADQVRQASYVLSEDFKSQGDLRNTHKSIRIGLQASMCRIGNTLDILQNLVIRFGEFHFRQELGGGDYGGLLTSSAHCFESDVTLASCSVIGSRVFIYCWPEEGRRHRMLISSLTEDLDDTYEIRKDLTETAENSLQTDGPEVGVLLHLIQKSFSVVVCRPDTFSALPQKTQRMICDTVYDFWRKQSPSPHNMSVQPGYHIFLPR